MRAAIAEANRAEREAREAAIAARKPVVPPRPRAGWNKRGGAAPVPRPPTEPGDVALHAERAKVEKRWDHKRHGTAPTLEHASRANTSPLRRLWLSGGIDAHQLAAAVEIAQVAERIARDVTVRTASLETRIDAGRRGDGAFFEALGAVRREVAYTRWREAMGPSVRPVLAMIVGDAQGEGEAAGFTVVAKRYGMSAGRARAMLIDALDRWAVEVKRACDWIDDRDVRIAHARVS